MGGCLWEVCNVGGMQCGRYAKQGPQSVCATIRRPRPRRTVCVCIGCSCCISCWMVRVLEACRPAKCAMHQRINSSISLRPLSCCAQQHTTYKIQDTTYLMHSCQLVAHTTCRTSTASNNAIAATRAQRGGVMSRVPTAIKTRQHSISPEYPISLYVFPTW